MTIIRFGVYSLRTDKYDGQTVGEIRSTIGAMYGGMSIGIARLLIDEIYVVRSGDDLRMYTSD